MVFQTGWKCQDFCAAADDCGLIEPGGMFGSDQAECRDNCSGIAMQEPDMFGCMEERVLAGQCSMQQMMGCMGGGPP